MGPLGCCVTINNKPSKRKSWDQQGRDGLFVGPDFESYRCFKVVDSKTKSTSISDKIEFIHSYLTQPTLNPEDRTVHAIRLLTCDLDDATVVRAEAKL